MLRCNSIALKNNYHPDGTPVFKFQHPDLPGDDLYFIHNTFFELPQTTPMDLWSFIWYYQETLNEFCE